MMDEPDDRFDVVVLGAGPGGYVAAIRAAQLGKRVVVERKYWGGICLNVGCIPAKALLRNAELAHIFTREAKTFGIRVDGQVSSDYGEAYGRSRKVADGRVKGVHYLMKKNKITEIDGRGTFLDPHTLQVAGFDGDARTIGFDPCVIATGATPKLLPGTRRTSPRGHLRGTDPRRGAATVDHHRGCRRDRVEFAYILHNYGVKVTIVEFLDCVAPLEDEEVSAELARQYRRLGIEVLTSTRVDAIDESEPRVRVTVTGKDGAQQVLEADKVLQAIGFAPNVTGYGLENTGVRVTERGAIDVDGRCRTNVPPLYAIGAGTAKLMLAHVAEAMGVIAAETLADAETMELDRAMIPRATFRQSQIASFGYTEEQARELGCDVKAAKFPFTANAKVNGLGDATSASRMRRPAAPPRNYHQGCLNGVWWIPIKTMPTVRSG
jgi:dihydrolipoamide dehydrogenase